MVCNCNNNQPPGPPPPLERQNYPPAPPPTPIIQETRHTDTRIVLEEEFSFPVVAKVMPRMLKMRTRRKQVEAAGSARQIKKLGAE
ncbi:hypothetical protein AAZX31_06G116100 [Glycine max]|uniref:Uncharacterized protein n=1 Tax=Glycine max TaxID=3847 RepID=A0A0R0JG19_SOYBN|nr:hypothetical protein JHK85_015448 [Glycine max]KAG5045686.1 hypothetical protein JHK86_015092 [Glycine max]KAG5148192.1 hypothetical protein JHK82_015073 [Glycine max]KAH1125501.1 hypothetical protein GYH30_014872 [Glycine max]KRH53376.1 hypothetical protein GLYMA_06G122100v4 [Glycine max]